MPELVAAESAGAEQTPLARILFRIELRAAKPGRNDDSAPTAATEESRWETLALASSEAVEQQIADAAAAFFGPGVRIHVSMGPGGSIELSLLLVALGALRLYRSHIENIQWFVGHVRSIIRRGLPAPPQPGQTVVVTAESIAVPALPPEAGTSPAESLASAAAEASESGRLGRLLPALLVAEGAVLVGLVAALLALAVD